MSKLFKAEGIVYCTDDEHPELQKTMVIEAENIENVPDAISDKTGWLIEKIENITEI